MAGIGFTLQKALGESRSGKLAVYGAAAFVAAGPWLLTLISLFLLLFWGEWFGVAPGGRELFFASVTYAMIGSNLISSTAQFFLTRYLADAIYVQSYDRLLSAFTGTFCYTGIAALVASSVVQSFLPLPISYKIWTVMLTVILTQLGLMMILLSAAKAYRDIARAFLLSLLILLTGAILYGLVLYGTGRIVDETALIGLFTIGEASALLWLGGVVVRDFPGNTPALYKLMPQHRRYPELIGIGLLYALTLWIDNLFYWLSDMQVMVADSYPLAPAYDLAKFWTFLAFIPSFTLFAVQVETQFYLVFRQFYNAIEAGDTLATVRLYEEDLRVESKMALWRITKVQSLVALVAWVMAQQFANLYSPEVGVFQWTIIGSVPHMVWITSFLFLLYFDARKRALWAVFIGLILLGVGTGVALYFEWPPGSGYLLGCVLMMISGLILLNKQTERLLFYAFYDPNGGEKKWLPPAATATKRQQRVGYPILSPLVEPVKESLQPESPAVKAKWELGMKLPPRKVRHGKTQQAEPEKRKDEET